MLLKRPHTYTCTLSLSETLLVDKATLLYITQTCLIILTLYPSKKAINLCNAGQHSDPHILLPLVSVEIKALLLTLELKSYSPIITAMISVGLECLHTLE